MSFQVNVSGHTEDDDKEYEIRNAFQEVVERFSEEISNASFYGKNGTHDLGLSDAKTASAGAAPPDDNPTTDTPSPQGPGAVGKEA